MAYIGMRNPRFWPISTPRVDGSAIVYDDPIIIVTFETNDNPDYGNDVIIDNDKGVNGYSVSLETNDISKEARAACLGWKPVGTGTTTHYEITDAAPPEGGLSYIRVKMFKGERKFETFFFHALQFLLKFFQQGVFQHVCHCFHSLSAALLMAGENRFSIAIKSSAFDSKRSQDRFIFFDHSARFIN